MPTGNPDPSKGDGYQGFKARWSAKKSRPANQSVESSQIDASDDTGVESHRKNEHCDTQPVNPETKAEGSGTGDAQNPSSHLSTSTAVDSTVPVDPEKFSSVESGKQFFDRQFPLGYKIVENVSENPKRGLSILVVAVNEVMGGQSYTVEDFEKVMKQEDFAAHVKSHTGKMFVSDSNSPFTLEEMRLLLVAINTELRLGVVESNKDGAFLCDEPDENSKIIWLYFDDKAIGPCEEPIGEWCALQAKSLRRIAGHADTVLDPPDTMVQVLRHSNKLKPTWLYAQIVDTRNEQPGQRPNVYPRSRGTNNSGLNVKLWRRGSEVDPHFSLEAEHWVEVMKDDEGTINKIEHRAKVKFHLDKRFGISNVKLVNKFEAVPDPKNPSKGSRMVEFTVHTPSTTENCDIINASWPTETQVALHIMSSYGKYVPTVDHPLRVKLVLLYNGKNQEPINHFIGELEKPRNYTQLFPYIHQRGETATINLNGHRTRTQLMAERYEDESAYEIARFHKTVAFRDVLELQTRIGYSNMIEWQYQRSVFEDIGVHEHIARFVINGKSTVMIHVQINPDVRLQDIPLDENVVFDVTVDAEFSEDGEEQKFSAVPADIGSSSTGKDTITMLALSDNAFKFRDFAAKSFESAEPLRVRTVAKFNAKQIGREQQGLIELPKKLRRFVDAFLNKAAASGVRSDVAANFIRREDVESILLDVKQKLELNEGQALAFDTLRELSDNVCMIHGPPGTGKTYVVCAQAHALVKLGFKVVAVTATNAASNKVMETGRDQFFKLADCDKTDLPIMVNRPSAENRQIYQNVTEHTMTDEEMAFVNELEASEDVGVSVINEIEQYQAIKDRRQQKAMEHQEMSLTFRVLSQIHAKQVPPVLRRPRGSTVQTDVRQDQTIKLEWFLERLSIKPYAELSDDDKKDFKYSYKAVEQYVLGTLPFVVCTPATVAHQIMNGFAFNENDRVVMLFDEAAMLPLKSMILAMAMSKFATKIVCIGLAGDHKQLNPLVTSEDFNEFADDMKSTLFHRRMQTKAPSVMLTENMRLHEDLLRFPSKKCYDNKLISNAVANSRQINTEYANYLSTYLAEADKTKLRLTAVDIRNGQCTMSEVSKSRTNLQSAVEICNLAVDIRSKIKPEVFDMAKELNIITPYKEQLKTINRLMMLAVKNHNFAHPENLMKRSELPLVVTIDGFQGKDNAYIWFDSCVSHAEMSAQLGFLQEDNRINVACTRAKQQLILFVRFAMLDEEVFASAKGKMTDPETKKLVICPNSYLQDLLLDIRNNGTHISKDVHVEADVLAAHQEKVGMRVISAEESGQDASDNTPQDHTTQDNTPQDDAWGTDDTAYMATTEVIDWGSGETGTSAALLTQEHLFKAGRNKKKLSHLDASKEVGGELIVKGEADDEHTHHVHTETWEPHQEEKEPGIKGTEGDKIGAESTGGEKIDW